MGRILQIQLRAWTYDEDQVRQAWPHLSALVWSETDKWAPVGARHGVMELAKALPDALRFGEWPEATRQSLKEGIAQVAVISGKLETALADWQPAIANHMSDQLEDALAALESAISGPKYA